jgi:predicted NUDIX family NTP pyrophosphohydrolase
MPPVSAGLALFRDDRRRLLLVHPTSGPWWASWSIPKGMVEPGEDALSAAIRETFEETGIRVDRDRIDPTRRDIPYVDKKGKTTKIVAWFTADVDGLPERLPTAQLQLAEVDHAEFLTYEGADRRILGRLRPILDLMRR